MATAGGMRVGFVFDDVLPESCLWTVPASAAPDPAAAPKARPATIKVVFQNVFISTLLSLLLPHRRQSGHYESHSESPDLNSG
jgi:hypothetical protein